VAAFVAGVAFVATLFFAEVAFVADVVFLAAVVLLAAAFVTGVAFVTAVIFLAAVFLVAVFLVAVFLVAVFFATVLVAPVPFVAGTAFFADEAPFFAVAREEPEDREDTAFRAAEAALPAIDRVVLRAMGNLPEPGARELGRVKRSRLLSCVGRRV